MNILVGVIFVVIGVFILTKLYPDVKNKIKEIKNMNITKISDLIKDFSSNNTDGYRKYVQLKVKTLNENLIIAPYSNREVAYYKYEIYMKTRKIEQDGKIDIDNEKIENMQPEKDVYLIDESCSESIVLKITDECSLDIPITFKKFETDRNMLNEDLITKHMPLNLGRTEVLGFDIQERTIEFNQDLYVLGEAYLSDKGVCIEKPKDDDKSFIVTTKNQEQYLKSLKKTSIIELGIGIVLSIFGIIMFVI